MVIKYNGDIWYIWEMLKKTNEEVVIDMDGRKIDCPFATIFAYAKNNQKKIKVTNHGGYCEKVKKYMPGVMENV